VVKKRHWRAPLCHLRKSHLNIFLTPVLRGIIRLFSGPNSFESPPKSGIGTSPAEWRRNARAESGNERKHKKRIKKKYVISIATAKN
jgi:hypothetical protein